LPWWPETKPRVDEFGRTIPTKEDTRPAAASTYVGAPNTGAKVK
jgi:hypothetical protein